MLNITNLLSKDLGVGDVFTTTTPLTYRSVDAENKPLYRLTNVGGKLITSTFAPSANINDVFRIQLGFRYNFN